jgi:[methyl-Co(III) methanol-specific corrinoid protein]:coenzyme M methyltransferase
MPPTLPFKMERIILYLRNQPPGRINGPVVLHVCGNADAIVPFMCSTGATGISIEEQTNLKEAVKLAHANGVKVFGNIATSTLTQTADQVHAEAIAALENGTDFLCPGCGLSPFTSLENILQLKKARDDFFAKSRRQTR